VQGRLNLALKGQLHQQLHEWSDEPCVLTELPADGGRPAWEEGVRRRHGGQDRLSEPAIRDRRVVEHAMNGAQGLAHASDSAPLGFLHLLGGAGVEVLDEPIGHR
jgi:hypothetical protein